MAAKLTANYIQRGEAIDYTNSGEDVIHLGDVISIGEGYLVGVAMDDIPPKATGTLAVQGVFRVSKETGVIKAGARVCISAEGKVQEHQDGDKPLGIAIEKAEEADRTVLVLLNA